MSSPRQCSRWITPLFITVLAVIQAACTPPPPEPPPPPLVEVTTPGRRTVTEYFYYTGTLESVATVEIRARVSGFLEAIHFDESSDVEEGDVLFTIETAPYELAVRRAEANLERAQAARRLAETRLQRIREAFDRNAANEIELVERQAELRQAEADVLAAEADLGTARLDRSYTEIRSPLTGRIDRHYVDLGNLVGREDATLLARVVTLDPMHVTFDVSESIALRYLESGKNGKIDDEAPPVEVGLADERGYRHSGRVDFVDNVLDESTGTLQVRAVLPNSSGKLYPGLFARIRVPWETRRNAVVIHEEAVGTGLDGKYVLLVDEQDVVSRQAVELGERQDDGMIAILDGLTGDETYIVRGVQKARPGAPVNPKPYETTDGESSNTKSPSEPAS